MVTDEKTQHLLRIASSELGFSEKILRSARKSRGISKARHIIMYTLWSKGYSHSSIGRLLNKSHATSISACRKVEFYPKLREEAQRLLKIVSVQEEPKAPKTKKYTGKWANLFKVYEAKCQICGMEDILEVHHRIPIKNGGSNEANNLMILCPNHHAMIHMGLLLIKTPKPLKMLKTYQSNNL